jgi:hypothetical protein
VSARGAPADAGPPPTVGETGGLRVQATFHDLGEHQAQAISAELIARAHELANTPELECDVDVSVELLPPREDGATGADAL